LDKVARQLNGSDGSANRRRLKKEMEELKEAGVSFGKSQGNNLDSQSENPEKDPDEEKT
jgi:hypothetical protein